ncbi:short chain dehydrogenase reductase [Exidia glandulosa HHB12029]|uniref:Short chain dehydrogenase reductase n=1 Tax=Exidia glandulosa HHB12029 TaxID=1314781 RepID=A0A165BWX8_EXIGL|nr:short chain dehydrogenase reductase [Exidia glandulosa HHB12029]
MPNAFGWGTKNDEVVDAFADRVKGRVFLVTGPAPNGLGDAALRALARAHPAALLLVGRSPAKYAPVIDAIKAIDPAIVVRVYGVDFNVLQTVRGGAGKILEENERIDVVINSAGVMRADLKYTVDGIEEHFQTCHVGHFLLTNLLMPLLKKSDEPRVVNVSSGAYRVGTGDYSDYNFKNQDFVWFKGYGQAKLANLHFSKALAARGVTSYALHPGVIHGTSLGPEFPPEILEQLRKGDSSKGMDLKEKSGGWLEDCQLVTPIGEGASKAGAPEELWKLSEKLVGQEFTF